MSSPTYLIDAEPNRVSANATLRDAMQVMTRTGVRIVAIDGEDGSLAGILVESDLRRAVLETGSLDASVSDHFNRSPSVLPVGLSVDELRARASLLAHPLIPLLDATGMVRQFADVLALRTKSDLPNAAVIMAGGEGRRLLPVTKNLPKALVPVSDRPVIDHILMQLQEAGFRRVYVAVRHLAHMIEAHLGMGDQYGVEIRYLREQGPLGTAGILQQLGGQESEPVLLTNCDILSDLDFRELVGFHVRHGHLATIATRTVSIPIPYGVVRQKDSLFIRIDEKPEINVEISAGIGVFSPTSFELIKIKERLDVPDLLQRLEAFSPKRIGCFHINGYWIDIGREADLDRARLAFDAYQFDDDLEV